MSFAASFRLLEASESSTLLLWLKVQQRGILSVGVILGVIVLYTIRYFASPYRKLPPGPRGYPIIGNLLELKTGQWLKFASWRKDYGELIYLNVAGQPIVVLNSHRVAVDLLDRRSGIYSDRPRSIVAGDIMTGGLIFALAQYGDTWRRMRKASHEGFNKGAVKRFYETQTTEAVFLACDLLAEPAKWNRHFLRAAASTILSVLYKYPSLTSEQDHVVLAITGFADRVTRAAYPGAYLVEFFPWMRYIPSSMAKWKRDAEECFKDGSAMFEGLLHAVEANVAKGDDHQSLGATLIRDAHKNKLSSREAIGGTDTSSVALAWWVLAMLAYPETQARAHAELDAVVGRTRLPTFADYPHLPYIRQVAPLGLPHRLTEDDWYQGMFIPKGTICISNIWQINRDPEIYGENAAHFDPTRHLDANGDIAPGPSDSKEEGHFSYGFGRRECPGRHVANSSLFIEIAITLWASKIERKKDALGKFLPLDLDGFIDHGVIVPPIPFECEITPRFLEASGLLSQERELRMS
ncbi:cytochrome P450 [Russula earlei]|uniref:Cytochrome P450 n=1 Tax=Russula earlei TaxID=71964 RepID=A0ACC0UIF0_9AGAM|nr:cytochrome P450 [Russula earlei]